MLKAVVIVTFLLVHASLVVQHSLTHSLALSYIYRTKIKNNRRKKKQR